MKKLIVIALVVMMAVLASGCQEELVYEECNPYDPWFCFAATAERPYAKIHGMYVPLVIDERIVGSWAVEGDEDGPSYIIRADNTIARFHPMQALKDGTFYEEGTWSYFASSTIRVIYAGGGGHYLEFSPFSEDGELVYVLEIVDGAQMVGGVMERWYTYTGEIL